MHFAIALTASDKISEDDIRTLLSADPLAMHLLSNNRKVHVDDDDYRET